MSEVQKKMPKWEGPSWAKIAFVFDAPTEEAERAGKVVVGKKDEALCRKYLKAFGIPRSQVLLATVAPSAGPKPEDLKRWAKWTIAELARRKPKVVAAIGEAAGYLGDAAHFSLPDPEDAEAEDGEELYKAAWAVRARKASRFGPFAGFVPPRPAAVADDEEAWKWAKPRVPVYVELKARGIRAVVEKRGGEASMWFADSPDRNRLRVPGFEDIRKAVHGISTDVVLDGTVAIEKDGVPTEDAARLRGNPDLRDGERVVFVVSDVPFWKVDGHEVPLDERTEWLDNFFPSQLAGQTCVVKAERRAVRTKREMEKAAEWASSKGGGYVVKQMDSGYPLEGTARGWAERSKDMDIRAVVIGRRKVGPGRWAYRGGILPSFSAGKTATNIVDFAGRKYVDLGDTMDTGVVAREGDVIDVRVRCLVRGWDGRKLAWFGPTVLGVDPSARTPSTAAQAEVAAERMGVMRARPPDAAADIAAAAFGDVAKADAGKFVVLKRDEGRRLVTGIALVPDVPDLQKDVVSKEEVFKAMQWWMENSQIVGRQHEGPMEAKIVECYAAPVAFDMDGQHVPEGAWVVTIHVTGNDDWQAVLDEKLTGFSIGGVGKRA